MSELSDLIASETAKPTTSELEEIRTELDLLTQENERLREELRYARRAKYRRTALGLFAAGMVGLIGAYLFPSVRILLIAIGATGVFAGLLTVFITPERFVSATVSDGVYATIGQLGDELRTQLGLTDRYLYVPIASTTTDPSVRLYVPQHDDFDLPDDESLQSVFVITDSEREYGVSLPPTGLQLFREFTKASPGETGDEPTDVAEALIDSLHGQFDLVTRASIEPDLDNDQLVFGITGSALGTVDRFDHPIPSFLGVGLAAGCDCPIAVVVTPVDSDDRYDYLVECSWEV